MRRTVLFIGGFIVISSLLSSCVSKKKFDALARAKRGVDQDLVELRQEKKNLEQQLQAAEDTFNAVRYQLTQNNAQKDKTIDALYSKLRNLESKQTELKSELTSVSDEIKNTKHASQGQIANLEKSLKKVITERNKLRQEMTTLQTNLQWENRKLKNEVATAQSNTKNKDAQLTKLKKDLDAANKSLEAFKKSKTETDAQIKKLTNQVNLLKKELIKK